MYMVAANLENHTGKHGVDFGESRSKGQPDGMPHKGFKVVFGVVLVHAGKIKRDSLKG